MNILNQIPKWLGWTAALLIPVAAILWNMNLPTRMGIALVTEQYLALILGLTFCVLFIAEAEAKQGALRWTLYVVALLGLSTLLYTSVVYTDLLNEIAYRPPVLTFIGVVTLALTVEGVRRRAGIALFLIVAAFFVYALLAHLVPGPLVGRNIGLIPLIQYVGFDPSAVYSTPLKVGASIVVVFVLFGALLFKTGGGEFFIDLALAMTGRTRGGAAKISIVASALLGSISGSAISNVATTGVITIPLMRRGGYSARDAGAIEAIASTGGQLTPPIMGAAAFLMAEFLEIAYLDVVIAAIIPAALYYFSVFVQVDLIAARDHLTVADKRAVPIAGVLKRGWHFLVPFAILIYGLFGLNWAPEDAALAASLSIIVLGFLRPYSGKRLAPAVLLEAFVETGRTMVELILVVATAGFVIGMLNATGLGFALTLTLVDAMSGNHLGLLLICAGICILLGMGMPTAGVYVLLATLVAPALVKIGIEPIAAHLFILYFGMMSAITPPIALAAFAAAAISKANAMATGLAACRIGWVSFLIPFMFVSSSALILQGGPVETMVDLGRAVIGIVLMSAAIVGYFGGALGVTARVMFVIIGLAVMPFGIVANDFALPVGMAMALVGLATLGATLWYGRFQKTTN